MLINIVVSNEDPGVTVNHDAGGGVGTVLKDSSHKVFPPLTALYLASMLIERSHEVRLIDENYVGGADGRRALLHPEYEWPDVLVILHALTTIEEDLKRIQIAKRNNPGMSVVSVGSFSSLFAEKLLGAGSSAVLANDAEFLIADAVEGKLSGFQSFHATAHDLEALPYPAWHLLDMERYTSYTVLSSRGCSLGCAYCPYRVFQGEEVIARCPESTLREIQWLHAAYSPDYFLFRDPIFTFDKRRAKEIVSGIQDRAPGVSWACETRFEFLDQGLIEAMSKANCHHVRLGIETANATVLTQSGRIQHPRAAEKYLSRAKEVIKSLREGGIKTLCFFMFGFPEDNESTVDEIREFITAADPDIALLNYTTPYPGTPLHGDMSEKGLIVQDDLASFGSKEPIVKTMHLSQEELFRLGSSLYADMQGRNRLFHPMR